MFRNKIIANIILFYFADYKQFKGQKMICIKSEQNKKYNKFPYLYCRQIKWISSNFLHMKFISPFKVFTSIIMNKLYYSSVIPLKCIFNSYSKYVEVFRCLKTCFVLVGLLPILRILVCIEFDNTTGGDISKFKFRDVISPYIITTLIITPSPLSQFYQYPHDFNVKTLIMRINID